MVDTSGDGTLRVGGDALTILVTGGAGYIGSQMVRTLLLSHARVVVLDDLSSGHREAVPPDVPLVVGTVADRSLVVSLLRAHKVETIFHFASRIQVGESVVNPRLYYRDNLAAGIALLESALDANVAHFILSSTAAVYGTPHSTPLDEAHSTEPINPYGETKLALEKMLFAYHRAYGLKCVALRYFNAAGADPEAGLGERHMPETHLIPLVIDAALGHREPLTVYGTDYPTRDGTCVRDYVHVKDLASAHLAALTYLRRGGGSGAMNLGTGTGATVREVISAVERLSGRKVPVVFGERRAGDPPELVASPARAFAELGWRPRHSSLDQIVQDAFTWHARTDRASSST